MTQTIYVDILFAVNLFMNFFLLLVTARLAHQPYKRLRLLAGAALEGFVFLCDSTAGTGYSLFPLPLRWSFLPSLSSLPFAPPPSNDF